LPRTAFVPRRFSVGLIHSAKTVDTETEPQLGWQASLVMTQPTRVRAPLDLVLIRVFLNNFQLPHTDAVQV
jgi:hypothetical protein